MKQGMRHDETWLTITPTPLPERGGLGRQAAAEARVAEF